MARILIDNTSERVEGPTWTSFHHETFLGGSMFLQKTSNGFPSSVGPFSVTFNGTSIALYGDTNSQVNQTGTVSIDGGPPFPTATFQGLRPFSIVTQFFQSPTLPDTTHTITVADLVVALDYMVVTAGNDTPLAQETLIVDDSDPAIVYDGPWVQNSSMLVFPPALPNGAQHEFLPFGNATHGTNTAGASATFTFTGTSVTVYGVIHDPPALGSLYVRYTMDGFPTEQRYYPTAPRPHYPWYSNTSLATGEHTLKIEVTDTGDGDWNYTLDYITYTPSFDSLGSKLSTSPSGTYGRHGTRPALIGAICGAVGGVLVLVLVGLVIFRKRVFLRTAYSRPASVERKDRRSSVFRALGDSNGPLALNDPFQIQGLQPNERAKGQFPALPPVSTVTNDLSDSASVQRMPPGAAPADSQAYRYNRGSGSTDAGARIQRLEQIVASVQRDLQVAGSSTMSERQPPPYKEDLP
ncbi:hypothetical protein LshimejAT787_0112200 [Lyophyllum shimeji]|uniref:Uncharacterized protein n=1 Tax=Lyophyllum shimeji TaxID=47721 RepID=A0A9P3PF52_LYOSH|nr:hypothetical protein LshimejAT787_0112200 [Lyophyllum shimeji]